MEERESQDVAEVTITVDWSDAATIPVTHVNQFVAQPGPPTMEGSPDGVYLLVGSIAPPIIPSDPEGQRRVFAALKDGLKVTGHARFHLSRERLEELIAILQQTADNYDELHARTQAKRTTEGDTP
ncbi:hypothetical protein [Planobispora longispora]|uniref:Uncharacterized protein n=1 Tax=Planobispora longispora TaxID=28887 RepID=A0A8J3RPU0_9ACTN|nr:hypothetical protein [Planobispora longispora]BFE85847.1 hypothetical protein GCM10020093_084480 [Planobispora longispora]GIH76123.1 hypothetical protein Plo01_25520 [Planobispora longispora]